MGICLAITKLFGDKEANIVVDPIISKHHVDYDAASWYPSTKMGLNLDLSALPKELGKLNKMRDDDDDE